MYIYISWMPFYTKQTSEHLYKTFCVLNKAVNELRLVFLSFFFWPAWSKCTANIVFRRLQVVRLGDFHGLQGDGGEDVVGALRYPALGRPVEGGSLHAGLLQLRVAGRVQVHLGQLECDRSGRLFKAAKGSGHPVIDNECEGHPSATTFLCNASQFPHRLKLLYSGRSARGSSGGIFSWMLSARLGSLRISWSHGEW